MALEPGDLEVIVQAVIAELNSRGVAGPKSRAKAFPEDASTLWADVWALVDADGFTRDDVRRASDRVKDWYLSNTAKNKRTNWHVVVARSMREGWGLRSGNDRN